MNNKLNNSASFLVYGDYRISLEKKSLEIVSDILNIDIEELKDNQDVRIYQDIKIDDVREIILSSVQGTYNLKKRIYIINNVEKLRNEVVNALLKLIEEPPQNVYIFLLTRKLDILQTIKSRCIIINLNLKEKFKISDYDLYKFLEYNIEDYLEYLDNKENLQLDINIDSFDDVLLYIKNYYEFKDLNNKIRYYYAIKYLIEEIYFLSENKVLFLKDKIFDILYDKNDNKITRERMYSFFNSCISKLIIKGDILIIEKLLTYKHAIRSNVNLKLIFLLFILELSGNNKRG